MNKLTVTFVIPNWNGKTLLEQHILSVIAASGNSEIIVVDDGSIDDSVAFLKHHYPKIKIIEKKNHEGYASTVNAGVLIAQGDIVVLLNTDIEPEKYFLKPLLSHFSDPNVFAVGCMDKSMENGKVVLRGRGIGRWDKGFYIHKRGEVDKTDTTWVSGGSGAFRRSMWNELGGMDEIFDPFYWEDIDLSYRATKKGYEVIFEPKSIVRHYHEEGNIKKEFTKEEIERIAFRNQYIFVWKHASGLQFLLHLLWNPLRLLKDMRSADKSMLRGFVLALPLFPSILLKRIGIIS